MARSRNDFFFFFCEEKDLALSLLYRLCENNVNWPSFVSLGWTVLGAQEADPFGSAVPRGPAVLRI